MKLVLALTTGTLLLVLALRGMGGDHEMSAMPEPEPIAAFVSMPRLPTSAPPPRVLTIQRSLARARLKRVEAGVKALVGGQPAPKEDARTHYREIAAAVREAIPPAELRQRLKQFGFKADMLRDGTLAQIDPNGGGLAMEQGKHGEAHLGALNGKLSAKIRQVFPELTFLTVLNPGFVVPPTSPNPDLLVESPNTSNSLPNCYWNLSGVGASWDVSNTVAIYEANVDSPFTSYTSMSLGDGYGAGSRVPGDPPYITYTSSHGGFIEANAGNANADAGSWFGVVAGASSLSGIWNFRYTQYEIQTTYVIC